MIQRCLTQVNRGCVLSCQAPTLEDLKLTAKCLYQNVTNTERVPKHDNQLLEAVCEAYNKHYPTQVCSV